MVDVSVRQRVRFADFELELETGELKRDGRVVRLPPQPSQVLVLLVRHHGSIVTRDEIRDALWPDGTVVDYDQSINFCIKRVREALADERLVETVPRKGYRFTAAVENIDTSANVPEPRRSNRALVIAAAAGLALAAAVATQWPPSEPPRLLPPSGPPHLLESVPVTTFEGYEREPALSPDGNFVAFTWDRGSGVFQLCVKAVAGDDVRQLTEGPGDVLTPTWHPDGTQIAYMRHVDNVDAIFVVPALGGTPRRLGVADDSEEGRHGLSWSPDGRELAFRERVDSGAHAMFLLDVETGHRTLVTHPPSFEHRDVLPAFSPDGRHLAFARLQRNGYGDVYVWSRDDQNVRRLSQDHALISGVAWDGDDAVLWTAAERDFGGGPLWRAPLNGGEARELLLREKPSQLSTVGRRLVYTVPRHFENIWKAPGPLAPHSFEPHPFITSTADDLYARVSPDGTKVLFTSGRSGKAELWVRDVESGDDAQLTNERYDAIFGTWSLTGDRIAFAIYDPEIRRAGLFVMPASGGFATVVAPPTPGLVTGQPTWSPDEEWLYSYGGPADEERQVWRVATVGGGREAITNTSGRRPLFHRDGTLFFSRGRTVWARAADGTETQVFATDIPALYWTIWSDQIVYLHRKSEAGAVSLDAFDLRTRQNTTLADLGVNRHFGDGVSVFPDGHGVLYTEWEVSGDLAVVELEP